MAYDHSRKNGNQGDVVKHSVLHNCVSQLLSHSAQDETFTYSESHCGRASYILPEGSEWKQGIGLLSLKTNEARKSFPRIDSYFQASLSSTMKVGQQYFGSSNIVFRCLRSNSRKFHFELFETDVHVYDDLARFYAPWLAEIHLNNGDGYEGVRSLASASLVLIDPPSLETERIASCIGDLRNKKISYICWTPRNSSSNGNKQESRAHIEFGERTDLGHHIAVMWAKASGAAQHTFGCRLTVSDDLKQVAEETTQQLTALTCDEGWTLA
jgi:23S rRNA A2030 N6-methylase RlmJ